MLNTSNKRLEALAKLEEIKAQAVEKSKQVLDILAAKITNKELVLKLGSTRQQSYHDKTQHLPILFLTPEDEEVGSINIFSEDGNDSICSVLLHYAGKTIQASDKDKWYSSDMYKVIQDFIFAQLDGEASVAEVINNYKEEVDALNEILNQFAK